MTQVRELKKEQHKLLFAAVKEVVKRSAALKRPVFGEPLVDRGDRNSGDVAAGDVAAPAESFLKADTSADGA